MDRETWLEKRTFHYKDFEDVSKLIELKKEQGVTISVGLPTMNVEKTLPAILAAVKDTLVDNYPLIDELAIIDSHSKDGTVKIARDLGVDVHFDDEALTSQGKEVGKGEALWKSLHALKGDIIVWIDSDIENIHPRFIYGLVGPILTNEKISYIKGFYQRPVRVGGTLYSTGGGRVTEILARPLLNLFYPDLSGLIQPLSGEYAGRREILESVPFYTGYAVEIALNVHIFRQFGLEAIGQVDLVKRVHLNQTTQALGRMAFGILQGVFELLEEEDKLKLKTELPNVIQTLKHFDSQYDFVPREIKITERPPIKTVPEYQEKRKALEKEK